MCKSSEVEESSSQGGSPKELYGWSGGWSRGQEQEVGPDERSLSDHRGLISTAQQCGLPACCRQCRAMEKHGT